MIATWLSIYFLVFPKNAKAVSAIESAIGFDYASNNANYKCQSGRSSDKIVEADNKVSIVVTIKV